VTQGNKPAAWVARPHCKQAVCGAVLSVSCVPVCSGWTQWARFGRSALQTLNCSSQRTSCAPPGGCSRRISKPAMAAFGSNTVCRSAGPTEACLCAQHLGTMMDVAAARQSLPSLELDLPKWTKDTAAVEIQRIVRGWCVLNRRLSPRPLSVRSHRVPKAAATRDRDVKRHVSTMRMRSADGCHATYVLGAPASTSRSAGTCSAARC
jgi:hypothetical protein